MLIEEIAQYLTNTLTQTEYGTQGLVSGVNLFIGRMPAEAPNACVVIGQYEGPPSEFTMGRSVSSIDTYKIQIMVRAEREDYPGGAAWAALIRNVLGYAPVLDRTLFTDLIRLEPSGVVNPSGYDELERPKFSVNFSAVLTSANEYP
jgi:hypothetical protein